MAHECGVDHIHSLPHNQGLAAAYMSGLETALCLGADVVVNTDGDNQYKADFIESLTQPILSGEAQLAIGRPSDRQYRSFLAGQAHASVAG